MQFTATIVSIINLKNLNKKFLIKLKKKKTNNSENECD